MHRWKKGSSKLIFRTPYYCIEENAYSHEELLGQHPYFTIDCPDWVNIIAIDKDHPYMDGAQLLWIRQYRAGSESVTLEIPGGSCDPEDNELSAAAARELVEESGAVAKRMVSLGWMSPNPALFKNKVHTFLALGCTLDPALKGGDLTEFIEVEWRPFKDRFATLLEKEAHHALTASALAVLQGHLDSKQGRL